VKKRLSVSQLKEKWAENQLRQEKLEQALEERGKLGHWVWVKGSALTWRLTELNAVTSLAPCMANVAHCPFN